MTLCYTPTWKIPLRVLMRTDIFTAAFRAISCCCLFYFFLLLFNYPTASFGPSEHLAVFEPGTFRFWLQRLNRLNHSSLIEVVLAGNGDEFSIMYVFILFEVAVVENGGDFSIMYIYVFFMIFISILIYLFFNIMYIQRSIVFHCSKVKLRIKRSVSRFSNVKKWNKMSQIEISKNSFLRNKTKLIINCWILYFLFGKQVAVWVQL